MLKRRGYAAVALCTVLGVTGAATGARLDDQVKSWQRFQPPNQSFSVKMPGGINKTMRSVSTPVGAVETDVWLTNMGTSAFAISVSNLPAFVATLVPNSVLYERAGEEMMEELGGQLKEIEPAQKGPFERWIIYEVPQTEDIPARTGRALMAARGDEVVVVNALVIEEDEPALQAFFDSLDISENP